MYSGATGELITENYLSLFSKCEKSFANKMKELHFVTEIKVIFIYINVDTHSENNLKIV